jgi:hypothetical protein
MSRAVIEAPVSDEVRAAVKAGWAAYKAATEEYGPSDDWDRKVIDQCIRAFVKQGRPFSANDMRPLLPEVRKCLISRRLIVAQNDGLIRYVGVTPSTLKSTKSARVNVYAPIPGSLQ